MDVQNTIHVVDLRFVICYPVVIFIQKNLFIITLLKTVTRRFGVGRLRMLYKTNVALFVGWVSENPGFLFGKITCTLDTTGF